MGRRLALLYQKIQMRCDKLRGKTGVGVLHSFIYSQKVPCEMQPYHTGKAWLGFQCNTCPPPPLGYLIGHVGTLYINAAHLLSCFLDSIFHHLDTKQLLKTQQCVLLVHSAGFLSFAW